MVAKSIAKKLLFIHKPTDYYFLNTSIHVFPTKMPISTTTLHTLYIHTHTYGYCLKLYILMRIDALHDRGLRMYPFLRTMSQFPSCGAHTRPLYNYCANCRLLISRDFTALAFGSKSQTGMSICMPGHTASLSHLRACELSQLHVIHIQSCQVEHVKFLES